MGLYRVYFDQWSPDQAYDEMLDIGFEPGLIGLKTFFWDHTPPGVGRFPEFPKFPEIPLDEKYNLQQVAL
ncbi:MAG: hypothetical protein EOP09_03320 [Proteobacteria bacterium]|nr:MAG: hypothetical protein EOP09_03320 [Pseudomonadota bacterium]